MSKRFLTVRDVKVMNPKSMRCEATSIMTSTTLNVGHSGDLVVLNSTNGSVLTLPPASAGTQFNIVVGWTAGNHSIVAPAASLVGVVSAGAVGTSGNVVGNGLTTINLSGTSGSAVGDSITLRSDGMRYFLSGAVADLLGAVIV